MKPRDRVLRAARALAGKRPNRPIHVSDVARLAKVSWPTARRHLGSDASLAKLLAAATPPESAADTRARLIAAAARLFGQEGYERTSLDDVAASAGLTKGAVYWHFENKRELLLAVARAAEPAEDPALFVELLVQARDPEVREALASAHREAAARIFGAEPSPLLVALAAGLLVARHIDPQIDTRALAEQLISRAR